MNENNILFDDITLLEKTLGEGSLNISSINANCDCVSYTTLDDDQDLNTTARSSSFVAAS